MNILNHFFIYKSKRPPAGVGNIVYTAQSQSERGRPLDPWLRPCTLWVRKEWLGCTSARGGRLQKLNSCVSKGGEILFCLCADSWQFLCLNLESLSPDTELMRLGPSCRKEQFSPYFICSLNSELTSHVFSWVVRYFFPVMSYEMVSLFW